MRYIHSVLFLMGATCFLVGCGNQAETNKSGPVIQNSLDQWKTVHATVTDMSKADKVMPVWGQQGTRLFLLYKETPEGDEAVYKARAEEILTYLRKETKIFPAPVKVAFGTVTDPSQTFEEMTTIYSFDNL